MRASRKKAQVGDVWKSPASGHLAKVVRDHGQYLVIKVDKGKGYGDPETCGTQSFLARRVLVERDGKAV
jgi:hypothetical protein